MDEYYRKYLKYKKKYLELKNNHRLANTRSINPIFTKIFDIQETDIRVKDLVLFEVEQIPVLPGKKPVLTNEQLIECIMIYNTTKKEDKSDEIHQLIINTLSKINHIYIIDYLNVLGYIKRDLNKNSYKKYDLEDAKYEFFRQLDKIVHKNTDNIYIVCIRDYENASKKYSNFFNRQRLPNNLIFIETEYINHHTKIPERYIGGIDDFIYWTLAIAFSLFTEEKQINMNELIQQPPLGSKRKSNALKFEIEDTYKKPNLILLSADTQKLYDENTNNLIQPVKNLQIELEKYDIKYIIINNIKKNILKEYFMDIFKIIVHKPVPIQNYVLDINGYRLGQRCTQNAFNQYRDNTNIDKITSDIYSKNCDNFEKYMTLIKWLQYKYFKCQEHTGYYCATSEDLIEKFLEGKI